VSIFNMAMREFGVSQILRQPARDEPDRPVREKESDVATDKSHSKFSVNNWRINAIGLPPNPPIASTSDVSTSKQEICDIGQAIRSTKSDCCHQQQQPSGELLGQRSLRKT